ncbi:signal peptidase I [Streptomyces sp. NPDC054842]
MRKGRGLAVAAWLLGPLGLLLCVGAVLQVRSGYTGATQASESMTPTYEVGDRLFLERVGGDEVRRGDVVLFSVPERYGELSVVQRVVGVGGDRVVCCEGEGPGERITVNGKPLEEPYVREGIADGTHRPYEVTVPPGRLFLLGDHRLNSRDSRFFPEDHEGTVPVGAVRARVLEDRTPLVVTVVAAVAGLVLALTGLGLGIAALATRRRRMVPPAPPWAVRV